MWKTSPAFSYPLRLLEYIDWDKYNRHRSLILKPVRGLFAFGPELSRAILLGYVAPMLSELSLEYVDHTRPVLMVVNAEDTSRFDGHHAHPELAPSHAIDLRAKINGSK